MPEGFKIHDVRLNRDWFLRLIRVHMKNIINLPEGEDRYFACADLKSTQSKDKLDLDFYAIRNGDGSWVMEKIFIHKVNGKPRFTYDSKNQIVPPPPAAD